MHKTVLPAILAALLAACAEPTPQPPPEPAAVQARRPAPEADAGPKLIRQNPHFRNLCQIKQVTSGPHLHNHAYPTCRTWSRDSKKLFVESSGPGPNGETVKGVRYLLAVDIETGKKEYLTGTGEGGAPGGGYGFDYAEEANCIVYIDGPCDNVYLLNLDTGKHGVVFTEKDGTLAGPPTIAQDGTRVAFWVMYPAKPNRFFDDYYTVIFAVDVDPATCAPRGEPHIVDAYPRRKGPTWEKSSRDGIHINHPQINPRNKDHICYSHEMLGSRPDGTPDRCRLWQAMYDGDRKRYLVRQPAGLDFTHEVIAPDGKSLIFPYMHGVGQVFFDTFEHRSLYYNPHQCPAHLTVSPDVRWIAGDVFCNVEDDKGKVWWAVMMLNIRSRKAAYLCWIPRSPGHPAHPHPVFSPDGKKIAFTMLDDDGVGQVAYVDVSGVMKRWDEVAEWQGGIASPKYPR